MANNKIKKTMIIAGIGAISFLPLNADAKKPTRNKKQKRTEQTTNITQIENNIRVLQADSINMANYKIFNDRFQSNVSKQIANNEKFAQKIAALFAYIKQNPTSLDSNLATHLDSLIHVLIEANVLAKRQAQVTDEFLDSGIVIGSDSHSTDEVYAKLAAHRALLKQAMKSKTK